MNVCRFLIIGLFFVFGACSSTDNKNNNLGQSSNSPSTNSAFVPGMGGEFQLNISKESSEKSTSSLVSSGKSIEDLEKENPKFMHSLKSNRDNARENSEQNFGPIAGGKLLVDSKLRADAEGEMEKMTADKSPHLASGSLEGESDFDRQKVHPFHGNQNLSSGMLNVNGEYVREDSRQFAKKILKAGNETFRFSYFKNGYVYNSPNDIIERTAGNGFNHGKFGPLHLKYDHYFSKHQSMNTYYSVGTGVSFIRGKGIFVNNQTSTTTFKFWEVPAEVGLGAELYLSDYFKLAGTFGGAVNMLYQSRDDLKSGEDGRRKVGFGYGPYAEGIFKTNFSAMFPSSAHDTFLESDITNVSFDLNVRYQKISGFNEDIVIDGVSVGAGFGFEFY